jgi:SAM-dependent methyltransferase
MSSNRRLDLQIEYWNETGPTKSFAHPVNVEEFSRCVSRQSRVLDYGCGYGRALGVMKSNGYTDLLGIDPASAMIEAARRNFPSISFEVMTDYRSVNLPSASVDAVLLFAVLTSVPSDEGQRAILSEITRLLRPSGVLYVSDMWLQSDARNVDRYIQFEKKYGVYGIFDLADGATVRHHDRAWIQTLTADYDVLFLEEISVHTMNGNPASAFQWIGRLRDRNFTTR